MAGRSYPFACYSKIANALPDPPSNPCKVAFRSGLWPEASSPRCRREGVPERRTYYPTGAEEEGLVHALLCGATSSHRDPHHERVIAPDATKEVRGCWFVMRRKRNRNTRFLLVNGPRTFGWVIHLPGDAHEDPNSARERETALLLLRQRTIAPNRGNRPCNHLKLSTIFSNHTGRRQLVLMITTRLCQQYQLTMAFW